MHSLLMADTSGLLAITDTLGLLGWAVWDKTWPYLLMLAGFSLIVFVHELGHFAVAKWAGVRVERFAIGFGREIWGFTRGETRYSFNILPLGGYVKMLGQEDFDDKTNELRFKADPRSFANKPVGHRMAIVSAGVIMNIIFAFVLFMIVFMIGTEVPPPQIAYVERDSPADKAGLEPGDEVMEVDKERVREFSEVQYSILLAEPHEPIEFKIKRGGEVLPSIEVMPEYNTPESSRDVKRQYVGIAPPITGEILAVGPEIDSTRPDHPHVGDVVVEVNGIKVTEENASLLMDSLVYDSREVWVHRRDPKAPSADPQRVRVEIPPLLSFQPAEAGDPWSATLLGLRPLAKLGRPIDPEGRGYYAGLEAGDVILMWDDMEYPSIADVTLSVLDNAERDIPFRVRKNNGQIRNGSVRPERHNRGPATIQAVWKDLGPGTTDDPRPQAYFDYVRPGGIAAQAGIATGDRIVAVNEIEFPNSKQLRDIVRKSAGNVLTLTIENQGGRHVRAVVRPQAPGTIDANFSLVADNLLVVSGVQPNINGKPSAAQIAGIPAGAKIQSVAGKPVKLWRELVEAFRANAGKAIEMRYVTSNGEERATDFPVPNSLQSALGVGPDARILSIDGRESVTIRKDGKSENLSVRYREGARAVLEQLLGHQDVPVRFRPNPLADAQVAYVDVTEDMLDSWLARVDFDPSILNAPRLVTLKGENVLDAVSIGIHKTYYFIFQIYTILERMIFTRSLGLESMSGPLGIFDMGGQVARADLVKFLFFMAMISANLAVINFLPLPIVDGGLMVFLLIEKIKGSPVSLRVQVATQMIGLFLIISIFLFVTYQDAVRMFG
jgi:membrane-associated protease RseP (regulator of RpoE activity)